MNKSDLSLKLQMNNNSFSRSDIDESIFCILDYISETLSAANRVEIRTFGSFSTRKRSKRISRNPKTGNCISVEEKYHPYFRAAKDLKASIKN